MATQLQLLASAALFHTAAGSLMATLAYMLILATRSSILQHPVHPASCSIAAQAASNAPDTHKLLTLVRNCSDCCNRLPACSTVLQQQQSKMSMMSYQALFNKACSFVYQNNLQGASLAKGPLSDPTGM
jgi:hypothetical protein